MDAVRGGGDDRRLTGQRLVLWEGLVEGHSVDKHKFETAHVVSIEDATMQPCIFSFVEH
jgi:hypothetical protein